MATRKLRVELEIEARDLTDEEKRADGDTMLDDPEFGPNYSELENDVSAYELGCVVCALFYEETIREAFAGSGLFITFGDDPKLVRAEFLPEQSQ